MQTNILWTGREYYSLENCLVTITEKGAVVDAAIVGSYEDKLYRVAYKIKTNPDWQTIFFDVTCQHNDEQQHISFEGDGKGNWTAGGKEMKAFKGCIDIDLPLTPFTNTLPINRLHLSEKESQQIRVIYLDMLASEVKPVHQKYTRLSATQYHYENVPNDFEATIEVDDLGLVVDYPALFVRTARLPANYR